jgi:Fe2+ transport system protein FeoA
MLTVQSRHDSSNSFPLTYATQGQIVELIELRAGDALSSRLMALGLAIGTEIRIVQSDTNGAMILAVKHDARLAIGRGMAQKMMVRLVKEAH